MELLGLVYGFIFQTLCVISIIVYTALGIDCYYGYPMFTKLTIHETILINGNIRDLK